MGKSQLVRKAMHSFSVYIASLQISRDVLKNTEEARGPPSERSVGDRSCSLRSRRSEKSNRSNASSIARNRIELELKQAQELDRLEQEVDLNRLERKKEMLGK